MFYYVNGTVAEIDAGAGGHRLRRRGLRLRHHKLYALPAEKGGTGQAVHLSECARGRHGAVRLSPIRASCGSFKLLIGVSGVGPKAALAILSAVTPQQLALAVVTEDEKALTAANGIGKKIAQRVILELKDKLATGGSAGRYIRQGRRARDGRGAPQQEK